MQELLEIVAAVKRRFSLTAAAITAYDPEYDQDDKALAAALAVMQELIKSDQGFFL